jgi:hypothetical protein
VLISSFAIPLLRTFLEARDFKQAEILCDQRVCHLTEIDPLRISVTGSYQVAKLSQR